MYWYLTIAFVSLIIAVSLIAFMGPDFKVFENKASEGRDIVCKEFDTLEQARETCLATPECKGLTFNSKTNKYCLKHTLRKATPKKGITFYKRAKGPWDRLMFAFGF